MVRRVRFQTIDRRRLDCVEKGNTGKNDLRSYSGNANRHGAIALKGEKYSSEPVALRTMVADWSMNC